MYEILVIESMVDVVYSVGGCAFLICSFLFLSNFKNSESLMRPLIFFLKM